MTFKAVFTTENVSEGEKIEIVVTEEPALSTDSQTYRIVQRGDRLPDGQQFVLCDSRRQAIGKAMEYIQGIEDMQT